MVPSSARTPPAACNERVPDRDTGAVDAFTYSINRPLQFPPNTEGRYRNSDPLTIGYLITEAERIWLTLSDGSAVEGHALSYDYDTGEYTRRLI